MFNNKICMYQDKLNYYCRNSSLKYKKVSSKQSIPFQTSPQKTNKVYHNNTDSNISNLSPSDSYILIQDQQQYSQDTHSIHENNQQEFYNNYQILSPNNPSQTFYNSNNNHQFEYQQFSQNMSPIVPKQIQPKQQFIITNQLDYQQENKQMKRYFSFSNNQSQLYSQIHSNQNRQRYQYFKKQSLKQQKVINNINKSARQSYSTQKQQKSKQWVKFIKTLKINQQKKTKKQYPINNLYKFNKKQHHINNEQYQQQIWITNQNLKNNQHDAHQDSIKWMNQSNQLQILKVDNKQQKQPIQNVQDFIKLKKQNSILQNNENNNIVEFIMQQTIPQQSNIIKVIKNQNDKYQAYQIGQQSQYNIFNKEKQQVNHELHHNKSEKHLQINPQFNISLCNKQIQNLQIQQTQYYQKQDQQINHYNFKEQINEQLYQQINNPKQITYKTKLLQNENSTYNHYILNQQKNISSNNKFEQLLINRNKLKVQKLPKKLRTNHLIAIPKNNYSQFKFKSSKLIQQTIQQLPVELHPVYLKIKDKIKEMEIEANAKLYYQNCKQIVLKCLYFLRKQMIEGQNYALLENQFFSSLQIEMNQIIIRGLIRKLGKYS